MLELRPYQSEAIEAVFDYWSNEAGNPLLDLATGTGKSLVMASIIQRLLEGWPDMRVVVVTHVAELIEQNYKELLGIWEWAPAGIYSAGLGRRDAHSPILFCGIQTVHNKAARIGHVDVLLVDEAHLIPSKASTMYGRFIAALREINPDLKILGLTATPYRLDSGRLDEGDDRLFDRVVYTYGIADAIRDGFLCPLISKATATDFDLTGVGRRGGDYVPGALQAAVDKHDVTRKAVDEILAYGHDRRSWMAFCAGVEHAVHVRDEIRSRGITCEVITGDTPKDERRTIIEAFKAGRIRCLTNNSVLCLDEETEILTRQGWVGIDDMTPNHLIAAWDTDGTIEFTKPKLIVRRDRSAGENMVSVSGRRNNIRVTSNHRMIVKKGRHDNNWTVVPAHEIVGRRVYIPVSGVANPCDITVGTDTVDEKTLKNRIRCVSFHNRKRGMNKEDARIAAEEQTRRLASLSPKSPRDLTIDECKFIGFWLGDGTMSPRCEFSQSTVYPKIIDWFDSVLSKCGYGHSRSVKIVNNGTQRDYVRWSVARGTGGNNQSRSSGYYLVEPYLNKLGSDLYWGLDESQFDALLYGFWMADGNHGAADHPPKNGTFIVGTQKPLYDLLQAIGACRGYRFTVTPLEERNPNHSPQWRMAWRRAEKCQFVVDLPILEDEFNSERVWCVTSSTGKLITRRKGKVSVVGNTTGFNAPAVDLIAFMRPTLSVSLYVQMAGRGTRLSPATGKENCLVLDFAGLVSQHGPVDAVKPRKPGKGDGEAPVKVCPHCHAINHASARTCMDCGAEFEIEDKPKHKATADSAPILAAAGPQWLSVSARRFRFHDKPEGTPSVRVEYTCGMVVHKEWCCPQHSKYAKEKADRWWRDHGGNMPAPASVNEWLERQGELMPTAEISIKPNGKYWKVVRARAERMEVAA